MALACELAGTRPSEVLEWTQAEQMLAAALQARLYREQTKGL